MKSRCFIPLIFSVFALHGFAQDEFSFDEEPAQEPVKQEADNYIELGLGYADGNGKLGEFSDSLDDTGFFPVGRIHLSTGDANEPLFYLDAGKGEYGASLDAGYRDPGNFFVRIEGRDSQKIEMANVLTVIPPGSDNVFNLPDDFLGTNNPDSYFRRDLKVERTGGSISLSRRFGPLKALLGFARQVSDGERSLAGSQGFAGTAIMIEPVEFSHNEFNAGLDYSEGRLSLGVNYYLSSFDNDNNRLLFDNPNLLAIGQEELALAPDNEFSRVDVDGSYALGEKTALLWLLNWGTAEQNESFLPYALDTAYYGGVFSSLPGKDLSGEVKRFNGSLKIVSRPTARLSLKAEYSVRDRDAEHAPHLLDSLSYRGSVTPLGAPSHTYNKDRQRLELEAGYRLYGGTRLRLGWMVEDIDRGRDELVLEESGLANVESQDSTKENRFWADYRIDAFNALNISFKLEHADRDADISEERIEHLHFVSTDAQGNLEAQGENTLPYYLSSRKQTIAGIHGTWMLSEAIVLDSGYSLVDEDFNNDFNGLDNRESQVVDVGLSIYPGRGLSVSLYGSYEDFQWRQNGTTSGGGGIVTALWSSEGDDESLVLGANVEWQAIPGTLKFTGDFTVSDSDSELSSYDRLNDESGDLPNYGSELIRLDMKAVWSVSPSTDINMRYIYEDWDISDFAWRDGELLDNIAFGWNPYQQNGHAVIVGFQRRF